MPRMPEPQRRLVCAQAREMIAVGQTRPLPLHLLTADPKRGVHLVALDGEATRPRGAGRRRWTMSG